MVQSPPELPFRLPHFPAVHIQCNRTIRFFVKGNGKFFCTIRNNLTGAINIFQYNQLAGTGSPGSFQPFSTAINIIIIRRIYIVCPSPIIERTVYYQTSIRITCIISRRREVCLRCFSVFLPVPVHPYHQTIVIL